MDCTDSPVDISNTSQTKSTVIIEQHETADDATKLEEDERGFIVV